MIIHIETLTPLHIGSGKELQGNFEYLHFPQDKRIALIDEQKVLDILGRDRIHQWVSTIDKREKLLDLLQQFRKEKLKPIEVGRRILMAKKGPQSLEQTLREQTHDGQGRPYMPGSSLKGAIRTVLFTAELFKNPHLIKDERNLGNWNKDNTRFFFKDDRRPKNPRKPHTQYGLEKNVLGKDPNHDIFRLLRPGDAFFDHTIALQTEVLNKKHDGWQVDPRLGMLIEAIPAGSESWLQLTQPEALLSCLERPAYRGKDPFGRFDKSQLGWEALVQQINVHSARLIRAELALWEQEGRPDALLSYMEKLESLLAETTSTDACILRVGFGGGVAAKTGDWQQELMTEQTYYRWGDSFRGGKPDFLFPKTRRQSPAGEPLGYIRLRAIDADEHSQLQARMAKQAAAQQTELKRVFIPEAVKPQFYKGRLRKGSTVDAYVFKDSQGKQKRIQLYLAAGNTPQMMLSYPADVILGKLIQVEILQMEGEQVTSVRFKGIKRKNV